MANCGECFVKHVEVVALLPSGVCPRCGADYGYPQTEEIARATTHDHARAGERGERVRDLADAILTELRAYGLVSDVARARPLIFHVLADDLYGNRAIDIPRELREP